jgi:hypothetical protein
MNILELKQIIDDYCMNNVELEKLQVCIPIQKIGYAAGTPVVSIRKVINGFDWDYNKLMLVPESELMLVNQETLDKLRQELKDLNITKAENSKLKSEIVRLKHEIAGLKDEY